MIACEVIAEVARGLPIIIALLCLFWMAVGALADDVGADLPGRRVALVVGNSNYSVAQLALANPKNDAEDVGAALKALGFDVITATDLDLAAFDTKVRDFKVKAKGAEVALFFYAGHAVQSDHVNYFIPVDANITQEAQLRRAAVSIEDVQEALAGVEGVQVMILDSCRDNPFSSLKAATRGIGAERTRGLERIVVSSGDSVVLYSTRSNDVASDGAPGARNSPFSRALVEVLKRPGEHSLQTILQDVAMLVKTESGNKQSPELTTSLSGTYLFSLENDRLRWDAVKTSLDPKVFRAFAARFPTSPLRRQAEQYAAVLEQQEALRRQPSAQAAKPAVEAARPPDKVDQTAKVCWENYQRLDLLRSGGDEGGLETLRRENTCESLRPSIEAALNAAVTAKRKATCDRLEAELRDDTQSHNAAALAAISPDAAPCPGLPEGIAQALADMSNADRQRQAAEDARRQAEEQQRETAQRQAICDDEAAKLAGIRTGTGTHRAEDAAALAASAGCDGVRPQALALADDLRRQEAQAAHEAQQRRVCTDEGRKLHDAVAAGARTALDTLNDTHACETLDVPGAIAAMEAAAKRLAEAQCTEDAGKLAAIAGGRGAHRADDADALGTSARCEAVRSQAFALADDLRRKDAQAAHEAAQASACAAEGRTLEEAVTSGTRATLDALGRAHDCETLDVPAAVARLEAAEAQRKQVVCADESRRLAAIAASQGAHRVDEANTLGRAAHCEAVRGQALALADSLQRQEAQATEAIRLANQQRACQTENGTLQAAIASGTRAAIETLGRAHVCTSLDVPGALAQLEAAEKRQQEAACDADAATLASLVNGQDAHRTEAVAALAKGARCDPVRRQAAALADDLLHQEAQIAHEETQRATCATEAQTLHGAVVAGPRAAIEALGRSHACETLDVAGALAQFDDVAAKRREEAQRACAVADVEGLASREDDKGLADLAAKCPSRGDDVAAALRDLKAKRLVADACRRDNEQLRHDVIARQAGAVRDLQKLTACPTLDAAGALASIAAASCASGLQTIAAMHDDDLPALRAMATDPDGCADLRTTAAQRLTRIETARREDVDCEARLTAATGRADLAALERLLGDASCGRRHDAIARALSDGQRAAEQAQQAQAACARDVAAASAVADEDEAALRRLASDRALCPGARSTATARLDRLTSLHAEADRGCDAALQAATTAVDVERLAQLTSDAICVRRQPAVRAAMAQAQQARTRDGQVRLASLGCYTGPPNGLLDEATLRAVTWYRTAKHEAGATQPTFSADLVKELATETTKVCLQQASLTPNDTTAPQATVEPPEAVAPPPRPPEPPVQATPTEPAPRIKHKTVSAPEPRPEPRAAPERRPAPEPKNPDAAAAVCRAERTTRADRADASVTGRAARHDTIGTQGTHLLLGRSAEPKLVRKAPV